AANAPTNSYAQASPLPISIHGQPGASWASAGNSFSSFWMKHGMTGRAYHQQNQDWRKKSERYPVRDRLTWLLVAAKRVLTRPRTGSPNIRYSMSDSYGCQVGKTRSFSTMMYTSMTLKN